MSTDVHFVVKHNFYDLCDVKKCRKYAERTAARLKKALHIAAPAIIWADDTYMNEDGIVDCFIRLPVYEVTLYLQRGYWMIHSGFHYYNVAKHDGDYFWIREMAFDLTRVLGQKEAWYCNDEAHDISLNMTFDEWLEFMVKKFGRIPEYDEKDFYELTEDGYLSYEDFYHDSFGDYGKRFNRINRRVKPDRLLGLDKTVSNYMRVEQGDGVNLVHKDTYERLFDEPVEDIVPNTIHGSVFQVRRNGQYAMFNNKGEQLTSFADGEWEYQYEKPRKKRGVVVYVHDVYLFNSASGEKIFMGTSEY